MAYSRKTKSRAKREEEELVRSYRNISPSSKKNKKRKKSHRTGGLIAIVSCLAAILLFLIAGYFFLNQAGTNGVILDGVSVAGVDVGGMTQAQAIEAVEKATRNTYSKTPMVVTVLDTKIELSADCVGQLNVSGAVKAAYQFGNTGNQSKREQEQKIAKTTGYSVDLTPYLQVKEDVIRDELSKLGKNYNTTLSQTTYEVTGKAPNQVLVVQLGTPEYGLDLDDLYTRVLNAYSQNVFTAEGYCGMVEPEPIDFAPIVEQYYEAPTDASFHPETYQILDGTDGYGLVLENVQKALEAANFGDKVEIPFEKIKPAITAKDLKSLLFRDTLATFTAEAESEENRDINLQLACKAINGIKIYPGEVFSFNDTLGKPTEKRGYKPCRTYSGTSVTETIGDGICQVASALYYCVLSCELEINMWDTHSVYPGFVPPGFDAFVEWDVTDFQFSNNGSYPIEIEAEADGGEVTISIIGTEIREYRVALEYDVLSETDYKTTYKEMRADNEDGYQEGDFIVEPSNGYRVKTYLCKFDKDTGKQLSRDLIEQSNYAARDAVICKIVSNP